MSKVKEEEERLRDRQIELERIRRLNEERAKQSKGREKGRRRVDNSSVEEKFDEKKVSTRREKKTENDRPRREDLEKAAVAIQATFRGFKSRQAIREELKRLEKKSHRKSFGFEMIFLRSKKKKPITIVSLFVNRA